MSDVNCPYCGKDLEICHDDGHGMDEGVLHHQECGECGKYFVFDTSILVLHEAYKADCLNDGNHEYEKTNTYPTEFSKFVCKICGEVK